MSFKFESGHLSQQGTEFSWHGLATSHTQQLGLDEAKRPVDGLWVAEVDAIVQAHDAHYGSGEFLQVVEQDHPLPDDVDGCRRVMGVTDNYYEWRHPVVMVGNLFDILTTCIGLICINR